MLEEPEVPERPEKPDEPKGHRVRIELVSRQTDGKAVKLGTYGIINGAFQIPLAEAEAGPFKITLEMVRLAPSAGNKQPWRVILKDGACHFYYRPGSFATNDIGIALCHFELTCQAMGLAGGFTQLTNRPEVAGLSYAMSWQ